MFQAKIDKKISWVFFYLKIAIFTDLLHRHVNVMGKFLLCLKM